MNKVLIVDDEESTRTTFSEVLNNYEFSSITASSGREAVDIFSQESPDAVLLDLKMPGMDGIETLKELKKINPDIPVILITAHGDIPTAVEAIKLGAYDFIAKPPDYKMLILTLERAVKKKELTQELNRVQENWRETMKELQREISQRKQTEEEIKKLNVELEQRVIERTSQLEDSNKQLRSEIIERGRIEETLQRYAEQLKALSHRLAEVQEEERRYMAKELHDEIGQALTGISLSLVSMAGMSAKEIRKRLKEAQSLVSGLLDRVRNMSLTLRPAMLDDFGLLPTLLWHFKRYTAQTSIPIHFRQRCLDTRFRPEIETAVYRIVQEALTNIARHACAAEAEVITLVEGDMLVVTVEDKGVGFEPEAVIVMKESVGLSGMRERLALLGGRLKIDSAPGRGTRLRAEIPLGDEGRRGNEARK